MQAFLNLLFVSIPLVSWGILSKYLGIPTQLTGLSLMFWTGLIMIFFYKGIITDLSNIKSLIIVSLLGILHGFAFLRYSKIVEDPVKYGFSDSGTFVASGSAAMVVLALIFGIVLLKDAVTFDKVVGVTLICSGIFFLNK